MPETEQFWTDIGRTWQMQIPSRVSGAELNQRVSVIPFPQELHSLRELGDLVGLLVDAIALTSYKEAVHFSLT